MIKGGKVTKFRWAWPRSLVISTELVNMSQTLDYPSIQVDQPVYPCFNDHLDPMRALPGFDELGWASILKAKGDLFQDQVIFLKTHGLDLGVIVLGDPLLVGNYFDLSSLFFFLKEVQCYIKLSGTLYLIEIESLERGHPYLGRNYSFCAKGHRVGCLTCCCHKCGAISP